MPGMSQHPSSDQLQLVIDLTAGMGLKATQGDEEGDLTHKAPITTAADEIINHFSLFFRENKTRHFM